MPTARKPCSVPGCGKISDHSGRCAEHAGQAERLKGSAAARGYTGKHRSRFRAGVLARDKWCKLCGRRATVADHWPLSRKQLIAAGADPDDPKHGRGLCADCDHRQTAARQPGGWNQAR